MELRKTLGLDALKDVQLLRNKSISIGIKYQHLKDRETVTDGFRIPTSYIHDLNELGGYAAFVKALHIAHQEMERSQKSYKIKMQAEDMLIAKMRGRVEMLLRDNEKLRLQNATMQKELHENAIYIHKYQSEKETRKNVENDKKSLEVTSLEREVALEAVVDEQKSKLYSLVSMIQQIYNEKNEMADTIKSKVIEIANLHQTVEEMRISYKRAQERCRMEIDRNESEHYRNKIHEIERNESKQSASIQNGRQDSFPRPASTPSLKLKLMKAIQSNNSPFGDMLYKEFESMKHEFYLADEKDYNIRPGSSAYSPKCSDTKKASQKKKRPQSAAARLGKYTMKAPGRGSEFLGSGLGLRKNEMYK